MTSEERDDWEVQILAMQENKTPAKLRARLASQLICDDQGKSIFTQNDVEALGKKNASALNKIFERVMTLNLVTNDDIESLSKN